ncbi:MAG: hydroxymethylbilane synthase [Gammaproteobacteria bacterium]|nr:hydroxymethylbilane synthase [Gammaproteobacteria bacterium]
MTMRTIRIGTRRSRLALWQANYVKDGLKRLYPDRDVELVEIVSEGARTLDIPLHQAGGKGLFLKELETALLEGETDLAVHSMKDVTMHLPDGLEIPVLCPREDPRDAFVSNRFDSLDSMSRGGRIGTCSLRRTCQLKAAYPHLAFENLRGNVDSRMAKLDSGQYDAIILAVAGLKRLGMESRIRQAISPDICLPAVGQGVVGIECRSGDSEIRDLILPMNDPDSAIRVDTERQVNAALNGGCHAPVAVFAEPFDDQGEGKLRVRAMVGELDGSTVLKSDRVGPCAAGHMLGEKVAMDLLRQGARAILDRFGGDRS